MLTNTQKKISIPLSWGELGPTLNWCERNCTSHWLYECVEPAGMIAGEYEFYFESEHDYVAFMIWKK